MTIAGSDSGAGAGIQADLKTFAALGVYGTSVITAITAQNTREVTSFEPVSVKLVEAQIDTVMADIGADAAKTGMLPSAEIVEAAARAIVNRHRISRFVCDPVMVSKGGSRLLDDGAVQAMRDYLLPIAMVVTPNIPEAEVLTGGTIKTLDDMRAAAEDIAAMGCQVVVIKGGHLPGAPIDLVYDGGDCEVLPGERIDTPNTHGTGCTFSAAITAHLAKGLRPVAAVREAKAYITAALKASYAIGSGHSPVNHFHALNL